MAGSINKIILVGNLGKDPDIRSGASGKIANFSLATSETWKDKNTGERKDQTEWHRVVVFNENLVNVCEAMLQKGTKVYIEGKLRTRKWQNQQGLDVYTTEIVLERFNGQMVILAGAKNLNQEPPAVGSELPDGANSAAIDSAMNTMTDDEIPF